jgi:hypothetical protein
MEIRLDSTDFFMDFVLLTVRIGGELSFLPYQAGTIRHAKKSANASASTTFRAAMGFDSTVDYCHTSEDKKQRKSPRVSSCVPEKKP